MSIDETWLSTWFVDNYIRACLQLNDCPPNISRLFDDVTTRMKLQNAVSALVALKQHSSVLNLSEVFTYFVDFLIPSLLYSTPLTARSCVCWMTELSFIEIKGICGYSPEFLAIVGLSKSVIFIVCYWLCVRKL